MALENSMLVMNGKQVGGNTEDLTGYQTKTDNTLETESKQIPEAINELNSKLSSVDDGVITPETGVLLTSYSLKKSINTVSINALVQLTPTLGSINTIGLIQTAFRPSPDRVYITCVNSTNDKLVICFVDKYGGIYIYPTSDDSTAVVQNYYICGAFVVG